MIRKLTITHQLGRILAIAIVFAWTLVPGLCGGAFAAGHDHSDGVVAHEHADADDDAHHKHKEPLSSCCRTIADAKFLTASPAEVPATKAIVVKFVTLNVETVALAKLVESRAVMPTTGPPPRSVRLLAYSSLAPPTRNA